MPIDLACVTCGHPMAAHNLGKTCPDGGRAEGFLLLDSHALDDVPPARRALERARLAWERHERRTDVQLSLSSLEAS